MSERKKESRIDRLYKRIESHGFESLTLGERSAFALHLFYREVNNGGIDMFFFNDAGKLADNALRGLESCGAQNMARILRQAMAVFPNGIVLTNQKERRKFLLEVLTPEQEELLENLTAEFYESSEPVSELMQSYIERHPEEFPT